MQEKYKYSHLKQEQDNGSWYYFLDGERLGKEYEYLSLVETLNLVGLDGWMLVNTIDTENYILMKKYFIV